MSIVIAISVAVSYIVVQTWYYSNGTLALLSNDTRFQGTEKPRGTMAVLLSATGTIRLDGTS